MHLVFLLSACSASAAPTVSLSDQKSLTHAAFLAGSSLIKYYVPSPFGSVEQSDASDTSGVQWYESGIMWETLLRNAQATNNAQYVPLITDALVNASYGTAGSFFGPPAIKNALAAVNNQWNDDIGWWGMAGLTGAEMSTPSTIMPRGATYYDLAANTADDMWYSWDENTCGGGIFWTRNRDVQITTANVNLKSIITNAQFISYAARLYLLKPDKTILDKGIKVYNWLITIGLADPISGQLFDGVVAPRCLNAQDHPADSYIYGQVIEGLTLLYKATNQTSYLTDAETFANVAIAKFSQNNIIRDTCEPTCPPNRVSPKGIFIRGLYVLFSLATPDMKIKISNLIKSSFTGMLLTCDSNFNCDNNWGPEGVVRTDFHSQLNAVELFNAAIFVSFPPQQTKLTVPPPSSSGARWFGYLSSYVVTALFSVL